MSVSIASLVADYQIGLAGHLGAASTVTKDNPAISIAVTMNKVLAALLGFLSVAMVSIEHVLRGSAAAEVLRWTMTAIRYHQVGALMVTMIGLALLIRPDMPCASALARSGWLFVAGTLLFSFSIYAAAVSGLEILTYITPVGGVTLMIAWLSLAWTASGRERGGA